jgi:hypothetical protein
MRSSFDGNSALTNRRHRMTSGRSPRRVVMIDGPRRRRTVDRAAVYDVGQVPQAFGDLHALLRRHEPAVARDRLHRGGGGPQLGHGGDWVAHNAVGTLAWR